MRMLRIEPKTLKLILISVCAVIALSILALTYFSIAPSDYPDKVTLDIKKGMYLSQTADMLEANHVIKSAFLFKVYAVLLSGKRQVQAGEYLFDKPESALRLAYRAVYGIQGLPKIKITIYEGSTSSDIANVLKKAIPKFDKQTFLALAKPYEGYLFPDTYFIYEDTEPAEIVALLRDTFADKTKGLLLEAQAFGKPIKDIITMASIVEKEANNSDDRKIIAGILWKRIEANMPLQVDVPFYYYLNKAASSITLDDLATDSPYNLYKHTGLTPTPISNPGLATIMDTINPTKTKYWYYLSDSKGTMHYAETHDGHIANKRKYIP